MAFSAQNSTEKALTAKQLRAAVLTAEDDLPDEQIAIACGTSRTTLNRWRTLPAFKDAVTAHTAELDRQMLRLAIARKRDRLKVLDSMQTKILRVFDARSTQYPDVPGADTGLLVGQLKQVKHVRTIGDGAAETWTEEQWEYSADTGLMRELRATQEQAAKELGQLTDKVDVGGTFTRRIVVELPPGMEASD